MTEIRNENLKNGDRELAEKMYAAFASNDDDDLFNCSGGTHALLVRYSFESARMTINKLPKDVAIQVLQLWIEKGENQ